MPFTKFWIEHESVLGLVSFGSSGASKKKISRPGFRGDAWAGGACGNHFRAGFTGTEDTGAVLGEKGMLTGGVVLGPSVEEQELEWVERGREPTDELAARPEKRRKTRE